MATQISMTVEGMPELKRLLSKAAWQLKNMTPVMRTIANAQYKSTVKNFRDEAFGVVDKWPELKKATQERRITKKHRRGAKNMLRPTGKHIFMRLHQSFSATEARVACTNWWAFVHNLGAPLRAFKMPRRTFLGIHKQDELQIVKIMERYLKKAIGG